MALSSLAQPRRGYLAQVLTVPPLIYPFQYNPTELTDSKRVKLDKRDPLPGLPGRGVEGLTAGVREAAGVFREVGASAGLYGVAKGAPEVLGRTFSAAELKRAQDEDRTLSFKLTIDGREQRPGEPARRRGEGGDILADLAILRSFVYPSLADPMDVWGAAEGSALTSWTALWFNQPPTALLVLGDLTVEGFVTDLKITETLFNADLNPVRAEVDITMTERIDSLAFVIDSLKRLGRAAYHTAYEDVGNVAGDVVG